SSNMDEDSSEESEAGSEDLPARPRHPPGYLRDYVTGIRNIDGQDDIENQVDLQNLAMAMFSPSEDPNTYEE
ncbi:hypothetical protein A2U01_0108176, partial [Trifolium medium]|nr:hypothetical protein [Trifolium medium]